MSKFASNYNNKEVTDFSEKQNEPRVNCYKCMRPLSTCVCECIKPIQTNTRFIILMHPKEYRKEKNGTGHMTQLQLDNSEIIVGVDFSENKRVNEILTNKHYSSFLLYPGKDSFNLSVRSSKEINSYMALQQHIFILDGTWPCARKMLKLSKNLQLLKRVSFDNKIKSKFIIKQQPESLCLSTVESVYTVINLLKKGGLERCNTDGLLEPFEKMIAFQIEYMLNPSAASYRPYTKKEIPLKTNYKNSQQRNTIYES